MDSRTGAWAMLGAGIAGVLLLGWHRMFKKIDYTEEESKAACDSEVVFFPDKKLQWSGGDSCGRGMEKVLRTLKLAKKNLDLALFSFSNRRIAREVINCVNRGVKVRLVADSPMIDQQGGQVKRLKEAGVCVVACQREGLMHHKFALIDNLILLNGSFNWTERAVWENCENLVITREKTLVKAFSAEFEQLFAADVCLCL